MKFDKKDLILVMLILMIFLISCKKEELKYSDIAYFANPVIEDLVSFFNVNNDFQECAKYFSTYFLSSIPPENLEKLFLKVYSSIGPYIDKTVEYKSIKQIKNNIIVIYSASFRDESEPVLITLTFTKGNPDYQLTGFSFDSPRLRSK